MGPGIVDARALLEASFDLGLDRGGVNLRAEAGGSAPSSVASLVAEVVGADAVSDDALDLHRFGPELATTVLRRQLPTPPAVDLQREAVSEHLASSVRNSRLRDWLGLEEQDPAATT